VLQGTDPTDPLDPAEGGPGDGGPGDGGPGDGGPGDGGPGDGEPDTDGDGLSDVLETQGLLLYYSFERKVDTGYTPYVYGPYILRTSFERVEEDEAGNPVRLLVEQTWDREVVSYDIFGNPSPGSWTESLEIVGTVGESGVVEYDGWEVNEAGHLIAVDEAEPTWHYHYDETRRWWVGV